MSNSLLRKEIRLALAHLDDPPYLEGLSIASRIADATQTPGLSRGQALRRALRLAIASLDPRVGKDDRGLTGRAFQVVYRYAIAKRSILSIGDELGISNRQCYRELERATEAVARIVEEIVLDTSEQPSIQGDLLRQQLVRLSTTQPLEIDLEAMVVDAVASVRRLADQQGARITLYQESQSIHVVGHRVMLRQALVNLLSHYVHERPGQEIRVHLRRDSHHVSLRILHTPGDNSPVHPTSPLAVATALLDSLGIRWSQSESEDGAAVFSAEFPLPERISVLVVDDNPDIARLYTRYLRGQPYRIYTAHSSVDAEQRLMDIEPAVVLLDVMMPDRDGWELLRTIRDRQSGPQPHIVVCSIIDDPALAAALGADAFLHKPVSGLALIETLERFRDPGHSPGARSPESS